MSLSRASRTAGSGSRREKWGGAAVAQWREVARGAEDHQRRRVDRQALEALDERVRGLDGGAHETFFTAWPPNWLRSAALTFAAKSPCRRESKRANSADVMTGIGTRRSMASSTVQRPSPESSTHPSIPASSLPSSSNARHASSQSHERTTEPCCQRC